MNLLRPLCLPDNTPAWKQDSRPAKPANHLQSESSISSESETTFNRSKVRSSLEPDVEVEDLDYEPLHRIEEEAHEKESAGEDFFKDDEQEENEDEEDFFHRQVEFDTLKLKIRPVVLFMVMISLASMAAAWLPGQAIHPLLATRFGWETPDSRTKHLQILEGVALAGCVVGLLAGTLLMRGGRRRVVVAGLFLIIIGSLFLLPIVWSVHLTGVAIQRVGGGLVVVPGARYIQDFVPNRILGICLASVAIALEAAQLLAVESCSLFQHNPDSDGLGAHRNFQFIMVMPGLIAIVALFIASSCVILDGPRFYIYSDQKSEAVKALNTVYILHRTELTKTRYAEKVFEYIQSTHLQAVIQVSPREAYYSDETYRRASWVGIGLVCALAANGHNSFMIHGDDVFGQLIDADGSHLNPKTCLVIMRISKIIAFGLYMYINRTLGRRTMLLTGSIGAMICLYGIAALCYTDQLSLQISLICVYSFIISLCLQIVVWIFLLETLSDVAFGFTVIVLYSFAMSIALTTRLVFDQMFDQGFFFMYAGLATVGSVFIYLKVAETKGLTEEQKKQIYIPGGVYGRPLRSGEAFGRKRNPKVVVGYIDFSNYQDR